MKQYRNLLALFIALAILAACGGGTGEGPGTTADSGGVTTTAAQPTTTVVDDTTTTAPDDDDDGGFDPSACRGTDAMDEAMEGYESAFTGEEIDYDEAIRQLQNAVDAAPAEIRDDFRIVAEDLVKMLTVLKEVDLKPGEIPTEAQLEKLSELDGMMESEEFAAAAERIQAWFEEHCS